MEHYIIVKWNEDITDKDEMYQKAKDAFKDVVNIDGVEKLDVYKSNTEKENRYDVMIKITCSKDGLAKYDASKLHQDWKNNFNQYIKLKTIFDCN